MHKDFEKYNPFRSVSWRYDRVLDLVEHKPKPRAIDRQRDDKIVTEYRKFLIKYRRARSDENRLRLFPGNPGLYYANMIHHHPDSEWQAIIQARLLTRATDEECSAYAETLPSTIQWYEALFFNVRDRLDGQDWIVKTIIGERLQQGGGKFGEMTTDQQNTLYKLFGYFGGPLILDAVTSGFVAGGIPTDRSEITGWFDRTLKTLTKSRATQAARVFEVNRYNVMELLQLHCQIMTLERQPSYEGGAETEMAMNISATLKEIPWSAGEDKAAALSPIQQHYMTTAIEPGSDDQMALAMGRVPENLKRIEHRRQIAITEETIETVVEG